LEWAKPVALVEAAGSASEVSHYLPVFPNSAKRQDAPCIAVMLDDVVELDVHRGSPVERAAYAAAPL